MLKNSSYTYYAELMGMLQSIPTDTDDTFYTLSQGDLIKILKLYKKNIISEKELVNLVDLIECRDGLRFESLELKEILHLIANQDISGKSLTELIDDTLQELQQ